MRKSYLPGYTALLLSSLLISLTVSAKPSTYTYRVLETHPHNKSMFTQGLIAQEQWIYESGGGYGRSRLLRYDKRSGKLDTRFKFPRALFAEGLTYFNSQLFLLTWQAGELFVYDPLDTEPQRRIRYKGEGWGLTHNDEMLIMSNGSDQLYFRSADDFSIQRTVSVHDDSKHWKNLNELEFARNKIWANVWGDNRILAIDPNDGKVLGVIDLTALREQTVKTNADNVLNGIAYDKQRNAFWVTGKFWPKRYLLDFVENKASEPKVISKPVVKP